ncbi:helix-turn-helix domain-containing protein [Alicyclobacillus dauci]|uniref:Helix-turn-helix domain-containing protein n=1 Tax=Alicyclobacillus dauci TaxID=1475485 RepID=A0ABY6YYF0_9BACL|nr:helix-turn-helix transcriptional regulator [Alicyclobacillus dauci]WAH35006.1 helix-turn-helix domain-containing protein [Alicyclobacillus dauci]
MKRGRRSGEILRALRNYKRKYQHAVGEFVGADVSTISRIESGELPVTSEVERRYVDACGGVNALRTLIDDSVELLNRLMGHNQPLKLA